MLVAAVAALDGLAPGEDAIGGGMGEGISARGFAVAGGDGGAAVQHLLGEGGGCIPVICTEAFLVRAILAEDFDFPQVVSGDDDIAIEMA